MNESMKKEVMPIVSTNSVDSGNKPRLVQNQSSEFAAMQKAVNNKRVLFEEVENRDVELQNARKAVEEKLVHRSKAVEQILLAHGPGPFRWKGQEVKIVKRGEIYFFRAKNQNVEEIG